MKAVPVITRAFVLMVRSALLPGVAWWLAASAVLGAPPDRAFVRARAYADAMIEKGRDHDGPVQSPMFASALDRATLTLIAKTNLPPLSGVRPQDRDCGGNVMHDQQLFQLLYRLSERTGEPKYARAADESLTWFFRNCQSPKTGLMAWGEHIAWNFTTEKPTAEPGKNPLHEIYESWELWPQVYRLTPAAADTFALGLWDHQIADQTIVLYNRHARWDEHGPAMGADFPRHGGFYVGVWAQAYAHTTQAALKAAMLTAIGRIADSFAKRRLPNGVLPAGVGPRYRDTYWPFGDLVMAVELHKAAALLPGPLAEKLRECGATSDATILALPHDLKPGGRGFIGRAIASSNRPDDAFATNGAGGNAAGSSPWATGYGQPSDAEWARLMLKRFEQTKNPRYRELFLAAADLYLASEPNQMPQDPLDVYPGVLADAIQLMLGVHRLTGETKYLDRARHFGRLAEAMFFEAGSPLPKASAHSTHYESITGGDDLELALLDLETGQR